MTGLSWQEFPELKQVSTVAEDVDVVATLTELFVAGLASRIAAN